MKVLIKENKRNKMGIFYFSLNIDISDLLLIFKLKNLNHQFSTLKYLMNNFILNMKGVYRLNLSSMHSILNMVLAILKFLTDQYHQYFMMKLCIRFISFNYSVLYSGYLRLTMLILLQHLWYHSCHLLFK